MWWRRWIKQWYSILSHNCSSHWLEVESQTERRVNLDVQHHGAEALTLYVCTLRHYLFAISSSLHPTTDDFVHFAITISPGVHCFRTWVLISWPLGDTGADARHNSAPPSKVLWLASLQRPELVVLQVQTDAYRSSEHLFYERHRRKSTGVHTTMRHFRGLAQCLEASQTQLRHGPSATFPRLPRPLLL